jgi:hypothetical protein
MIDSLRKFLQVISRDFVTLSVIALLAISVALPSYERSPEDTGEYTMCWLA